MTLDCDIGSLFVVDQHAVKSFPVARILPPSPSSLDSDLSNLYKRTISGDAGVYTDIVFLVEGSTQNNHHRKSILDSHFEILDDRTRFETDVLTVRHDGFYECR